MPRLLPIASRAVLVSLWLAPLGCRPELPGSGEHAGGGGGGGTGEAAPAWSLEPDAPPEDAPLALRLVARGAGRVDPRRVRLVAGRLGPGHLRQLAAGSPSRALEDRFLSAQAWRRGEDLVVAPLAALEPGEEYAISIPPHDEALALVAGAGRPASWLALAWPPGGAPSPEPAAVLCRGEDLPPVDLEVELAPGIVGRATRGAVGDLGPRCLRVRPLEPAPAGTLLQPPPSLRVDDVELALDPAPVEVGSALPPEIPRRACAADEQPLGPTCALVADDRAVIRTPDAWLLWALRAGDVEIVARTAPGEAFVLHPLPPSSRIGVEIGWSDVASREHRAATHLRTGAPRAHLVLDEVYANPIGAEPTSEWIELRNDGAVEAPLVGLRLLDVGGEVALPSLTLAAGEVVLLVAEEFAPDPLLDPSPPPGVRVVRLERLGRSGLSNDGELLRLVDPAGRVLSAVPGLATEPGTSLSRRASWLADEVASFAVGAPTPGAPNVPASSP